MSNNDLHYEQMFHQNFDPMLLLKEGVFIDANEAAVKIYGVGCKNDLIGKIPLDFSPTRQRDGTLSSTHAAEHFAEVMKHKKVTFEWMHHCAKGNSFDVEVRLSYIQTKTDDFVMAHMRDITEELEKRRQLDILTERYALAINGSAEGLWDWDLETNELFLSVGWKKMLGYADDELKSEYDSFANNIHPDDLEDVLEKVREHIETQNEGIDIVIRMKHQNGHYIWVHAKGKALFSKEGKAYRMVGFHSDIDTFMKQEKRLSLLQKAYESTSDSIIIINAKTGQIVDSNNVTFRQLGYTKSQICSKYVWEIKENTFSLEQWQNSVKKIKEQGAYTIKTRHKRKDKSLYTVEVHAVVIVFDDEEYVVSTIRDLTTEEAYRQDLLNQKVFLDTILDNISNGVATCDAQGNLQYFNKALLKLHGIDQENIPASQWAQHYSLYHSDGTTLMQKEEIPLFRALKEDHVKDIEMVVAPVNQEKKILIANARKMLDEEGNSLGAVVSMHDITQKKDALLKAEKANASKSIFLANMSHEIRTPMNAILGFAELLQKSELTDSQRQYLTTIQGSANSLLDLINDILDLSKIESGKLLLQEQRVCICDLLHHLHDIFSLKLKEKDLFYTVDCPLDLCILGDEARLKQVFLNVIGNAIKFTKVGGISIKIGIEANETLKIEIKDTGVGIPLSQHELIFKAFEQQENQDYITYGGTGLGLSICKQLLELMNGSISIDTHTKKGSNFIIKLNNIIRLKSKKKETIEKESLCELPDCLVLIVDDVMTNRLLIEAYFEETEVRTLQACNGKEAIEMVKKHNPDLVLMDIKMPVMDGIEATKILKADPGTSLCKISALTADIVDKEKENILREGFDLCLTKPISQEELFRGVMSLLENKNE